MQKILVLHGPNLNLLGSREPNIYGATDLATLNNKLISQAQRQNFTLICKQTNAEHEFIDHIHAAKQQNAAALIINAAAFTHTSIAIRDALLAVKLPFIEVHITNIYAREEFRQRSFLADIADGLIIGCGALGYELALTAVIQILTNNRDE